MNKSESTEMLIKKLEEVPPVDHSFNVERDVQLPAPPAKISKKTTPEQLMVIEGQRTWAAIAVTLWLTLNVQEKMDKGVGAMTRRVLDVDREKVHQIFITTLTGELMVSLKASVNAYMQTLPGRLGERL